jgi:hypothetical protein
MNSGDTMDACEPWRSRCTGRGGLLLLLVLLLLPAALVGCASNGCGSM